MVVLWCKLLDLTRMLTLIGIMTLENAREGIGFLADVRRMNVGITRAKYALLIVGHKRSLEVPSQVNFVR